MNLPAVLFTLIFTTLYCLLILYTGLRLRQSFDSIMSPFASKVYWVLFVILGLMFQLGRIKAGFVPKQLTDCFSIAGSYWMGALFYLFLVIAAIDFVILAGRIVKLAPADAGRRIWSSPVTGILVSLSVTVICIWGIYNASNVKTVHYDININKSTGGVKGVHAVMLSDLHLGIINGRGKLAKTVDLVNSQNPDIVFICGDIVDEDTAPLVEQNMKEEFKRIKSKYGTFAVLGNHDYYGGKPWVVEEELGSAGVTVLKDDVVKVSDSFYIVGRDDKGSSGVETKRKKLSDLVKGVDRSLPIIIMDHQPKSINETKDSGADLMLSGHTHHGQLFPNQLVTHMMYELDWGYMRKGPLQVIVTSGVGTFGPPMRTGCDSEIVDITVVYQV